MTSFRDYLAKRGLTDDTEFMSHLSDAVFALPLAALREQASISQSALAKRLNKSQAAVSKFECRNDFLLSTFHEYVEALGGKIDIVISVGEKAFGLKEEKDDDGSRYFCLEAKKARASKSAAILKFAANDFATLESRKRPSPTASSWANAQASLSAGHTQSSTYIRLLLDAATEKAANDETQSAAA